MADRFDPINEIAAATIGTAVHLAVPGLGSLAAAAIKEFTANGVNLEAEIQSELATAITLAKGTPPIPRRAFFKRRKAKAQEKAIRETFGKKMGLQDLAQLGQGKDDVPAQDAQPSGKPDDPKLALIAKTQLASAAVAGEVPTSWQDEFAGTLAIAVNAGLNSEAGTFDWHELMGLETSDGRPSDTEVAEWSRVVTRLFAARLEANDELLPLANQLRRYDEAAVQNALLWRLDQQRVALQIIAAVLALVALLVLGVDIDLLV